MVRKDSINIQDLPVNCSCWSGNSFIQNPQFEWIVLKAKRLVINNYLFYLLNRKDRNNYSNQAHSLQTFSKDLLFSFPGGQTVVFL